MLTNSYIKHSNINFNTIYLSIVTTADVTAKITWSK